MAVLHIYILYNARGSLLGKANYAYRKLTSPSPSAASASTSSPNQPDRESVCAACDLTHAGLSLTETPLWKSTKRRLISSGGSKTAVQVEQLHQDELTPELRTWMKGKEMVYPMVLARMEQDEQERTEVVMSREELGRCGRRSVKEDGHDLFLETLRDNVKQKMGLEMVIPPSTSSTASTT